MTHILVVDDDSRIAGLCNEILDRRGYKVMTATNGQEFIENIQKQRFDLLITDLRMPHMDGLMCIIKALELHPDIGIIVMTGSSDLEEWEKEGIEKFAYRLILKPFSPVNLENTVDSYFKVRRET